MATYYCEKDDVEQVFGTEQVAEYANLTGEADDATITARINWWRAAATEEINGAARKAAYQIVPLVDKDGNTPTTVKLLAAVLVGVWLYEASGSKDFDPKTGRPSHRLYFMRAWARRRLQEIRDGVVILDAV